MKLVDVRKPPFSKRPELFNNKNSYTDSQRFASLVRLSGVPGITYSSVRSPSVGSCVAMLSPTGFASKRLESWDENWSCIADAKGARWINTSPRIETAPMSFSYA